MKMPLTLKYQEVGDYFADIIVNDQIIIEIKAAESLSDEHKAQLINYLKATDKEVGMLLNFGKKICENPSNPCHPCSIEVCGIDE